MPVFFFCELNIFFFFLIFVFLVEGNTALHFTQSPEVSFFSFTLFSIFFLSHLSFSLFFFQIAVKILASLDDAVSVRSGFCNTQNDQVLFSSPLSSIFSLSLFS